jgi:signal transduction histidine kinase/ligand-binding sensor domain-containing protein/CheY-like chemotaxis protein
MLLCPGVLLAQGNLSFRHIKKRDGLSQNSVFAIAQDGDGFLWVGTRDGLNRYDGYHLRQYRHQDTVPGSLVANDVRALYHDPHTHYLWVCTPQGLSRYDAATDQFRTYQLSASGASDGPSEVLRCVQRDAQQRLWVGTDQGLYRYLEAEDRFAFLPYRWPDQTLRRLDINALHANADGSLWVGCEQGLLRLDRDSTGQLALMPIGDPYALGHPLLDTHIKAILPGAGGTLWIGTHEAGVFQWNPATGAIRQYRHDAADPTSLSHDNVRAMGMDQQGRLWVGTFMGLNVFHHDRQGFTHHFHQASDPKSLSNNSIRSIFFDAAGSAWVGTYYGGINYHNPRLAGFTTYQAGAAPKHLSHPIVSSFWEDANENLWIGTEGGGINYYDRSKATFTHYLSSPDGLRGNNVKTLHGSNDSLWIGTFAQGLHLFQPETKRWTYFTHDDSEANSLSHDNVYSLCQAGTALWVATYGGGLNRLDLRRGRWQAFRHDANLPTTLASDLTRVLLRDRSGHLWVGTDAGLDRATATHDGQLRFEHLLPGHIIYSLQEASDGTIWVGTYHHGLFALDPKGQVVTHYTEAQGLPGHVIFGILEDQQGRIWISTDHGLARIQPLDGSVSSYNYSDGLDNLEFNFNAYYRTRAGELIFGGTNGFTTLVPSDIRLNTFVPPIVITELTSFNRRIEVGAADSLLHQSIDHTERLVFPYNRASFSLRFAALDYLNPANNHYAYRLKGLDEAWTYVQGRPEATYTLQRAGTYVLHIKGGNNDGVWNHEERTIRIEVLPPPWLSPGAYLIYALLLGLMVVSIVWLVRLRHRLQLEQLAKAQQEALHQAKVRFYTDITHEFRTPLTLILGPIEELLSQGASEGGQRQLVAVQHNAQRLLNLVNQLLTFRRLESDHEPMQVVKGDLVPFVHEIFFCFQAHAQQRGIAYHFESAETELWLWYDADKLEKVVYNLLANAFKFTADGGTIDLRVKRMGTKAQVEVEDSGRGMTRELQAHIFKRFVKGKDAHADQSSGIGLALTQQLVALHRGQIDLRSQPGIGSCFTVRLPLGKDHFDREDIQPLGESSTYPGADGLAATLTEASFPAWSVAPPEDHTTAPLLLVVEDNHAVRDYLHQLFATHYRVLVAVDGEEGLTMARAQQPDLVISDVMMPRLDGVSMCSQLKSDIETSHLPVILLTARTGQMFRVEGLETGADAYVTKPFSPYELRLRVRNLLAARQATREKFATVLNLEPKQIAVTSADEDFLTRAIAAVEHYMGDPDFHVEEFARELAVSRPLLFTKLKGITSQTPNTFVKTLRLKRAAQLLTDSDLGVAEVAYQVGFRDARYFRRCFQQQFGHPPSTYREANQESEQG